MKLELYQPLFKSTELSTDASWKPILLQQLENVFFKPSYGHFPKWLLAFEQLSTLKTSHYRFDTSVIEIGTAHDIKPEKQACYLNTLKQLHPWRKGPFNVFGIHIETEWRCDKKWQRLQSCLPDLTNKTVLDVGCGNGYYMLRMLGEGAKTVIGVDPTLVFLAQFYALTQTIRHPVNAHLLPLPFEELPVQLNQFDCVFSMGVLYHRRDPLEHLKRLYHHTREGGQVILETLIIDTEESTELIPKHRYAGMRNVWSVPSPSLVQSWLLESGFKNVQLHNRQVTGLDEQRTTDWMQNYSLSNFLDPVNPKLTIEGYPAPARAIFSASRA